MKNHVREQHEGKDGHFPQRKASKQSPEEDTTQIHKPNEQIKDTVTIEKEQFENLQDFLLQTGQEKEELTIRKKEWINHMEKMNEKLKIAEDDKRQVTEKLNHLNALINIPILGLAIPNKNANKELQYDCTLCGQKT